MINKLRRKKMKDTFLKWLAFTLFLGVCALYSCNEEQWVDYRIGQRKSKHRNEDLTIAKAQQWYEEHYAPVVTARSSFTDADNHVKMKPGWDKAKESNRRRYEVVEVPIMTQKPHLLMDAETQKRWNPDVPEKFIRNTAKIVIERDKKTGRTRSFVMIFVGSYDYLKNTHSMGKNSYLYRQPDFDGMVLFYELNGSLVNGWKYTNGKITASIAPKIVLDGEEESTAIKSRGWVEECYTDYIYEPNWTCSEDVDVSYDEEYGDYVVTPECWEDGDWVETEVCYGYWEDDDNNYDDDSFVGGSGTSGGNNTSGENEDNGGDEEDDENERFVKDFFNEVSMNDESIALLKEQLETLMSKKGYDMMLSLIKQNPINNISISSSVNIGGYNPSDRTIIFNSAINITGGLGEELIHHVQNVLYPNGISQYNLDNGGISQIEFEAKVLQDILCMINMDGCQFLGAVVDENNSDQGYSAWLLSVCQSGESFPDNDDLFMKEASDDKNYLDYLNIFNEDSNRNNYNSEIIDDLLPVLFNYLKDKIQLP